MDRAGAGWGWGLRWGLGHPKSVVPYSMWARTGVGDRVVMDMARLWAGLGLGAGWGDGTSIGMLRA